MPHLILSGSADLRQVFTKFTAGRADSNGWIIKLKNCLISHDGTLLIFDCTAVRSGFSQDFFIRAENKDPRVTVRVDPYMRIERNEGVQRAITAIANLVGELAGDLKFDKSNLPEEVLAQAGFPNAGSQATPES